MRNPVNRLPKETRDRRLLDSFKKGDQVRESTRHEGECLVSSSQHANVWYRVAYDPESGRYSCGCQWWQERGEACRHLVRVSWEMHEAKKRAAAVAA